MPKIPKAKQNLVRLKSDSKPNTIKILVVGSAVSTQKPGYLESLRSIASEKYNINIEILNVSIGGCNTEASIAHLKGNLFYTSEDINASYCIIEKVPAERHNLFSQLSITEKKSDAPGFQKKSNIRAFATRAKKIFE